MLRIADPHRLTPPFLSLFLYIQITSFPLDKRHFENTTACRLKNTAGKFPLSRSYLIYKKSPIRYFFTEKQKNPPQAILRRIFYCNNLTLCHPANVCFHLYPF